MMSSFQIALALVIAAAIGASIAWLAVRAKGLTVQARLDDREREMLIVRGDLAVARDEMAKTVRDLERLTGTVDAERVCRC